MAKAKAKPETSESTDSTSTTTVVEPAPPAERPVATSPLAGSAPGAPILNQNRTVDYSGIKVTHR
jgi:hypothetical protein